MKITDWPAHERPREKLLNQGAKSLSDAELLAIFLRTGSKGKTAVDLARELLIDFGSLRALMQAERKQFNRTHGLGDAKYAQLQAVMEMARRHLRESVERGDILRNPSDTRKFICAQLRHYAFEVFGCLFLDNQHRMIKFEELFRGTIDNTSIYPREIVKIALQLNAGAVIFAHNHPSGMATPSHADRQITRKLINALALIDIRVLDHFIVGDGDAYSFAEHGLI